MSSNLCLNEEHQEQQYQQTSSQTECNEQKHLTKEERFKRLMLKFEISQVDKLKKLKHFKIVFIFDDSTSMNTGMLCEIYILFCVKI